MSLPIVDENRVLPVSLRVLITVTVSIVIAIVYVVTTNIQITNRININDTRIEKLESHQDKQDEQLSYLKTLMIRIADKLGVDTSDPEKRNTIKNLGSGVLFSL